MCEYCGCRDIPLIGRLTNEHYEAVNLMGALRDAIAAGDADTVARAAKDMGDELFPHNDSEESGLFVELLKEEYFRPTVEELMDDHDRFREVVTAIGEGAVERYEEFEELLRHHIDREENGLFPAVAVSLDGPAWERIEEATHEFNHATDREHSHLEHPGA